MEGWALKRVLGWEKDIEDVTETAVIEDANVAHPELEIVGGCAYGSSVAEVVVFLYAGVVERLEVCHGGMRS